MKQLYSFCLAWLSLLMLPSAYTVSAQTPAWQLALTPAHTSGSNSFVRATATDGVGNIYLAGYFSGTVDFGATRLISAGGRDAFVAKWSTTTGLFTWAHRAGGTTDDFFTALTVSGSSIYLVGEFASPAATVGSITLTNADTRGIAADVLIAKLTDMGSTVGFIWAERAGGRGGDGATALAVSGSSLYVTGSFGSTTALFGTVTLTNVNPLAYFDVFVAKLTDDGNAGRFVWALGAGGTTSERAYAVGVNGQSVYVAGNFDSLTATFGSSTLVNANPNTVNVASQDIFVAKLTDAGATATFSWAERIGDAGDDVATALAVVGPALYLTGALSSLSLVVGSTTLVNAGNGTGSDVLVAKMLDAGASAGFAWAQRAGGTGDDAAIGIAVAGTAVFVAGLFDSPVATFGAGSVTSAGARDAFVTRLADAGSNASFQWVQAGGGAGSDAAHSVALLGRRVYVAGYVSPPAALGSHFLTSASAGVAAFLASLTDPTLSATNMVLGKATATLYPNPAHTASTVQLPVVPGAPTSTLTLLDALGRTLRTETVALPAAGLRHELNLTGVAPGIYTLRVQAGEATAVRRLVVE